jgi:glucose uptake protein GlcU
MLFNMSSFQLKKSYNEQSHLIYIYTYIPSISITKKKRYEKAFTLIAAGIVLLINGNFICVLINLQN